MLQRERREREEYECKARIPSKSTLQTFGRFVDVKMNEKKEAIFLPRFTRKQTVVVAADLLIRKEKS